MTLEPQQLLGEKFIQWVDATDIVADNLLPGFYDPEFLALDRSFRSQKDQYVELGELVRTVSMPVREARELRWFAVPDRGRIEIRDGSTLILNASGLPREAILVAREPLAIRGKLPLALWREDIWGGKGSASAGIIVLESLTTESVAWLGKELREPYCQNQIRQIFAPWVWDL